MLERLQVYKCEQTGTVVEVMQGGSCELSCCNKPMKPMTENTVDASKEKHVPVIERTGGKIKVKIGSVPHPMEEKHYIAFIELVVGDRVCRQYLKPGQAPEAVFDCQAEQVTVREYCNLHGLWKA